MNSTCNEHELASVYKSRLTVSSVQSSAGVVVQQMAAGSSRKLRLSWHSWSLRPIFSVAVYILLCCLCTPTHVHASGSTVSPWARWRGGNARAQASEATAAQQSERAYYSYSDEQDIEETVLSWAQRFCQQPGNELFIEVPREFMQVIALLLHPAVRNAACCSFVHVL
jgi:hypothetical protein